ncbi:TPA: hypothetical protein N0F65_010931 [Lagenidium giganteum]|uniref:Uncharacterized protein n=1 Tax=Lagenidium giganteum TaxID=4803 RepID=A0AAV2YY17_9STRA|nr:TPA: hypothetical protein N0F65_010931 [Lagenidium giganteum]
MSDNRVNIDAVWGEMQQDSVAIKAASVQKLLKKSMVPTLSKRRKAKANVDASKLSLPSTVMTSLSVEDTNEARITRRSSERDAGAFNLQLQLNRLADEKPQVRKRAALALEAHFLAEDGTAMTEEMFDLMAKPLFKRFNDSIEKVREVCIRLTTRFLQQQEVDLLQVVPYLMPAVVKRINSQWAFDEENNVFTRDQFLHDAFKRGRIFVNENEVTRIRPQELSEEIRLLFLELLDALLTNAFKRNASSLLNAYIFDVMLILVSGVHDDFHEANIKSCHVVGKLSEHMVSVMKHFSIAFVRSVKDLLLHRLARVRVAALDAIRLLVSCPDFAKCRGSGTEAIADLIGHRDDNVIPVAAFYTSEVRLNYFAKLDQDSNVLVRRTFFAMISDWMTNLPDRYDHEARLMPYLLSAVSDENAEISAAAIATLDVLGRRHEEEQGEEVLEIKQYGVDGRNPTYNYTKRLPAPFRDHRPTLGTRLFVRSRSRRFLKTILIELNNWQSATRAHAVRLLKCVIVYSEETITVDVHLLIQTLLKCWRLDPTIQPDLEDIADLTGRFTSPNTYMEIILSRLRGDAEVTCIILPRATANAIEVLDGLMQGSTDKMLLPHVQEILAALSTKHILDFEAADVQRALASTINHLLELLKRKGKDTVSAYFLQHGRLTTIDRLYVSILRTLLVLKSREATSIAATSSMTLLAEVEELPTVESVLTRHFPTLFGQLREALSAISVVDWSPRCSEQVALQQLLSGTDKDTLMQHVVALDEFFTTMQQHTEASTISTPSTNTCTSATTTRADTFITLRTILNQRHVLISDPPSKHVPAIDADAPISSTPKAPATASQKKLKKEATATATATHTRTTNPAAAPSPHSKMSGKQSPMRMFIMLPMIFLMGKVDFENPMILNSARAAFLFCQLLSILLGLYIKKQIEAKNDRRKIFVPAPASPFDQSPNYDNLTETTYVEHETTKAGEFLKQTLIGAGISSFIHFRIGVNHVVLIQAVMTPMNLYDNPLVQAYVLGKRNGRIWNERLEGESASDAAAAAGAATDKKSAAAGKKAADLSPEEAIAKTLAAGVDADFDELWEAVKSAINTQTKEDKWNALMVACGSPIDTEEFIRKIVQAGIDVTAVDGDGWSALHWSAFHGRPEAAEALLESCTPAKRVVLLNIKANDGRTATEVAEGESNDDVVEVIAKYTTGKQTSNADTAAKDSEVRRRKGKNTAETTTTSVDDVD